MVRNAFTMIELIFAIVVISIAVVSLPMMTQATSKGIESNIVQEAIFATASITNESTTYYWDKTSADDLNVSNMLKVVNTGDCSATTKQRPGHISRLCLADTTTTALNGFNVNALESSVKLYTDDPTVLTGIDALTGKASYKNSYKVAVVVTNCNSGCTQFGDEASNSDLKEIAVTVTQDSSSTPLVVFKAYSANIGEPNIAQRIF